MRRFQLKYFFYLLSFTVFSSCAEVKEAAAEPQVQILPPQELYGQLFYDVQTNENIFPDSKTFVDAVPLYDVQEIRKKYEMLEDKSTSQLKIFVNENFAIPKNDSNYKTDSASIQKHITHLWDVLKRPADEEKSGTLLPLPNPYIVPGGRFREIYYWDSYFTMLGLKEDGEHETIRNMVDNFSYLIETYGFIPNGNRTYYLGRSQPPFYAEMVKLLAEIDGDETLVKYLPFLVKEYNFWMSGHEKLDENNNAVKRVVLLPEGEVLNRYWDENNEPRPESYREDVKTANEALQLYPNKTREEIYRNLRAAAESGWDFSSRWLEKDSKGNFSLATTHTTQILPVDLNSLLYNLEQTISKAYKLQENTEKAAEFQQKALKRKAAIKKYFWNSSEGFFMDFNFYKMEHTPVFSLAGVYPLFFNIAEAGQAKSVANKIEKDFLKPGGVVTTPYATGEQWDAPNGWAPLQFLTIEGLRNYEEDKLAAEIKNRWLQLNTKVYNRNFKLLEKYNVEDLSRESGGGEYPTQDGFGWTNGVYLKLMRE